MWSEQEVKCPTCRMKGPFRMFGRAWINLNKEPPLDNQVRITCPFGTHTFALKRIRQYFTDAEWGQVLEPFEKEKAKWLP